MYMKAGSQLKNYSINIGFGLTLLISLIVVVNQFESLVGLDPFYRITMPALCFAFSFTTSAINVRLGLIGCGFTLPLLPNLTWQIQQYFGYGRILSLHNAGLDLVAGLFLGGLVNQLYKKKFVDFKNSFPWQLGLLMIFLTVSVILAVSRNLHQTSSIFQPSSLIYNLTHLRSLGWHDDYRPIFDWIVYGCASSIIYIVITTLGALPKRNDYIFKPLIIGLIVAAIVGFRQSKYGIGLSYDLIYFRPDRFGYVALGFQHDLHAFAGQMLIGAIGLFGYLYYAKSLWDKALILCCIPMSWVALFLSKSKSNFALAVACLAVICAIWFFRHSRLIIPVLKASLLGIVLIFFSAIFFQEIWIDILTKFANSIGLPDLAALNLKLSYRPEVYLAALKFFTFNPILGLGQSEFYRQSANYALTNSHFLSIDQNGENAHNYFLQTLVENGLIGIVLFAILIFSPIIEIKNRRLLIPAGVALGAIFVGNIFAHSMLVRENLFIAASLIGLMYAWLRSAQNVTSTINIHAGHEVEKSTLIDHFLSLLARPRFVIACSIIMAALGIREIYHSFRSQPFLADVQCYKAQPLDPSGWTTGLFKVAIPEGAKGMTINIKGTQPYVTKRPLTATLNIVHGENRLIEQSQVLFDRDGPFEIKVSFPNGLVADDGEYRAEIRLQRCFIPRNLKINMDGRRLGVQIESVTAHY